jgi:hypothetical protein
VTSPADSGEPEIDVIPRKKVQRGGAPVRTESMSKARSLSRLRMGVVTRSHHPNRRRITPGESLSDGRLGQWCVGFTTVRTAGWSVES